MLPVAGHGLFNFKLLMCCHVVSAWRKQGSRFWRIARFRRLCSCFQFITGSQLKIATCGTPLPGI